MHKIKKGDLLFEGRRRNENLFLIYLVLNTSGEGWTGKTLICHDPTTNTSLSDKSFESWNLAWRSNDAWIRKIL